MAYKLKYRDSNKYLQDSDLDFLRKCKNEELEIFKDIFKKNHYNIIPESSTPKGLNLFLKIFYDSDHKTDNIFLDCNRCGSLFTVKYEVFNEIHSISDETLKCDNCHEILVDRVPLDMKVGTNKQNWTYIAEHIQRAGGNSIANKLRSNHGVYYKTILDEVLTEFGVKYNKADSIIDKENLLLINTISNSLMKMDPTSREELLKSSGIKAKKGRHAIELALKGYLKSKGFLPYKLLSSIIYSISGFFGKTLPFSFYVGLSKWLNLYLGPVSIGISAALTLKEITDPAKRITIPCVLLIASLRQSYFQESLSKAA